LLLRKAIGQDQFVFAAINDGSKDQSLSILQQYASRYPELRVVDKPNSGHGQSCVEGYRLAVDQGAVWVFQIDSDGQCDPKYFADFWQMRHQYPVIYGFRQQRDDGIGRYLISRAVELVVLLATASWVRDPNVPYRLMRTDAVAPIVENFPKDFYLANILVAVLQNKGFKIHWVNIRFRSRPGAASGIKYGFFLKQGYNLWIQIQKMKGVV
jgi:dolichol-phosphate mannosyltransferase